MLASDVVGAGAVRLILDDFFLVETFFHRALKLNDQLLPLVEFLGVRQSANFYLLALDPSDADAAGSRARRKLIRQIHRSRLKPLRGGDGGGELQNVLMALRNHLRLLARALERVEIEVAGDKLHARQTFLCAGGVATAGDDGA